MLFTIHQLFVLKNWLIEGTLSSWSWGQCHKSSILTFFMQVVWRFILPNSKNCPQFAAQICFRRVIYLPENIRHNGPNVGIRLWSRRIIFTFFKVSYVYNFWIAEFFSGGKLAKCLCLILSPSYRDQVFAGASRTQKV